VWLYFSLILGRCLLLSVNANRMRTRLADSRRKLAASLEQVQQLASHDELTGTLNRRSLMAALERERSRTERSGAPFSITMIDLDHFKRVNDTHGHATGDEVLRAFAATVNGTMRATDIFGRYGGEEFLMILFDTTPALALKAMERMAPPLPRKTGARSRRTCRSLCRPASPATARARTSNSCFTARTRRCTRPKTQAAIPSSRARHEQLRHPQRDKGQRQLIL